MVSLVESPVVSLVESPGSGKVVAVPQVGGLLVCQQVGITATRGRLDIRQFGESN